MTARRPLQWDGDAPRCVQCCELWFAPVFREACASVAIDRGTDPHTLARRTVTFYHMRRHESAMRIAAGLAGVR